MVGIERKFKVPENVLQPADAVLCAARMALQCRGDTDEPISLVNLSRASQRYQEWKAHLPRVIPHYAVKCNPDKQFLQELQSLGCNFDCASSAEIDQVLSIGASPHSIVYSNPCKMRSNIRHAHTVGVRLMSFDNANELQKVAVEHPDARLLLRLVCDDASAQCPMSSKFGAVPVDWDALLAEASKLSLDVVGVSFHVGSGCTDPASFEKALCDAKEIFRLASARGFTMGVLDIGGGYPGVCTTTIAFPSLAAMISQQLEKHFPVGAFPLLQVIAEPGRFFACSAASLLTKVIAKAQPSGGKTQDGDSANFRYYLNDGVYGSFNCLIYDHAEAVPELLKTYEGPAKPCWVFGPTCDGFDVLLQDYAMPELQEGDWLLWRNMGAYTSAAGSNFNGMPWATALYYREDHGSSGVCFHEATSEKQGRGDQKTSNVAAAWKVVNPTAWAKRPEWKWLLLFVCSGTWALKTVTFSWAASNRDFSPFTPPIVQSAGLALCLLVALVCKYGAKEMLPMKDRAYILFSISGFLEGLMFCLQNLALTKVSATAVTVLMQGQFFVVVFLKAWFMQSFPSMAQIMLTSAICLIFSYELATSIDDDVDDGLGARFGSCVLPLLGAAFCSGACDFALEGLTKRSMSVAKNQGAELMRCMVYHELFKIPVSVAMLYFLDYDSVKIGVLHGWDYSVVLGGAGASALALIFVNASVVLHGSVSTNAYTALEVVIVYMLDVFVLHAAQFSMAAFFEMCCFAGMIAAYHWDVVSWPGQWAMQSKLNLANAEK